MPENDEPSWPSSDEDTGSGGQPGQGSENKADSADSKADNQATSQLPVPPPSSNGSSHGSTDRLAVPKITPPEQKTSWFQPARDLPPEPEPPWMQQPSSPPSQQTQQLQRPEYRPEPPREQSEQRPQQQPEYRTESPREQSEQRPQQQSEPRSLQQPEYRSEPPREQPEQRPQQQPESRPLQQPEYRPDRFEPPRQQEPIPSASYQNAAPMRIEPNGDLHPAEATTGAEQTPPPGQPEKSAPPKPKRRKRGLLIGGLVLLLVVALGVAAALPQVSNRLKLPWAPNAPKGGEPSPVAVTRVLNGPDAAGAAPSAAAISAALKGPAGNSVLGKLTGSVIDPATGAVLWDRGSGEALTPASTTKLLTVAAALLSLDHGLQLSTKVVQGAQPGTVVLVAGGDPTLNSQPAGKDNFYPGSARLDDLVTQVKQAGGSVKKVQLDVSAYVGPVTAPGWDPSDAPSTYAAQVVPGMLDGGRSSPNDDHAARVANPATALAQKLADRLGATAAGQTTAPAGARVLGEVKSPPLTELTNDLLQHSDNILADAVARQTAIGAKAEPSFAGAAKATKEVLTQNGFDLTGVDLNDGSGLSRSNKIPAKVLSQILAVAAGPDGKDPRTVKLRPLLAGLPVAGGSGTLDSRYKDSNSSPGKGWVRAKTGTLSGVNTLAGVVLDSDGRLLVFALMSSTSDTAAPDPIRAALDALPAALRGCGCH